MPSRRSRPQPAPTGAICPAGRFAIALDGASWLVWDIPTQRPARVGALIGLPQGPLALALSPGGRALVVGGADGTVTEFELTTGRVRWTVCAHRAPVVAITADGGRVTSVAADRTVWTDTWPAEPERSGATGPAVRIGLAVATVVAVGAGWLPALALAAVPALLGLGSRRRFRLRLSLSGSERGVSRG